MVSSRQASRSSVGPAVGRFAGLASALYVLQGCVAAPTLVPADPVAAASEPSAAAGTSAPPATGPTVVAPLPRDAERALVAAFVRARDLVAQDTGVALDDLELVIADDERIDSVVRRETARLVRAQFDDPAFAERFVERMMRGQRGTFVALYVPSTDSVLVNRRLYAEYAGTAARRARAFPESGASGNPAGDASPREVRDAALLALMIHEVVHAVDDRRHDIDGTRTLDFRASFAESAVYEGHAQWRTRKLCAAAGCLQGLAALDAFMFDTPGGNPPNQLAQSAVALSRNVLEYSYVEGERFVEALAARPDGEAALSRLLAAPPSDPVQILDPGSWPDDAREARNRRLFDAASGFEHPWHAPGWARVETSPLKGTNLRADPERRVNAVEGFTRLLVAMGAMELHDQTRPGAGSIEVTLLQGESAQTAALFARTLHANAPGTMRTAVSLAPEPLAPSTGAPTLLLHAELPPDEAPDGGWRTLVAQRGPWVVQIAAAAGRDARELEAWALSTFDRLERAG